MMKAIAVTLAFTTITTQVVDAFAPAKHFAVFQLNGKNHATTSFPSYSRPVTTIQLSKSTHSTGFKPDPVIAVGNLFLLTEFIKIIFCKFSISFPASLAGCGALFSYFLLGPAGSTVYSSLAPGAAILTKWLPVMFVPSLIALPLAGGLGSRAEVRQILFFIAMIQI
jgi:putative effector of murein hydrolase LrgA (UPF0299 family)